MKAQDFDSRFDSGEEVAEHLDTQQARRPKQELKRVNVDFPSWMVDSLDDEAQRVGVSRQSIIKVWLAERIEARRGITPPTRNTP